MWELDCEAEHRKIGVFKLWCLRLLKVPWNARRSNQSILKEIGPGCSLGDWCWSWNSNTLATSCEELTRWKSPWCWEGLGAGGEGDNRGWDGWMASPTRWAWVWVNSGSWWWTGRPGVLRFMGSQRVRHDWATELNWTDGLGDWIMKWQPTPVFLSGESLGWGAWWAAMYGVAQSRTRLKWLSSSSSMAWGAGRDKRRNEEKDMLWDFYWRGQNVLKLKALMVV